MSKSVEHIVPESLGNKRNVLPQGIVCDTCNNYFSIKIEKQLLDQDFFKSLRHRNKIESKRKRIPKGKAIIPHTNYEAEVILERGQPATLRLDPASFDAVKSGKVTYIVVPYVQEPDKTNRIIARFLGKMALEAIAQRLTKNIDGLNYLINDEQFDLLRKYVRYNSENIIWNYHVRKIYAEDAPFILNDGTTTGMLYEYDILVTELEEWYFIIVLKGYEFAINIGGPSLDGYLSWLEEHQHRSPLYVTSKYSSDFPIPPFPEK